MIKLLENRNTEMAIKIVELQKASYIVEAELIGFMQIPPLLEVPEDIINSEEVYYGCFVEEDLAGIISYTVDKDVLDICKVAVHPKFFKRGIATKLIKLVEQIAGIRSIIVSTGFKNDPAVKLYTSLGYVETDVCEVGPGVLIVKFEKKL